MARPTKYKPEYCKEIIEFFDIEPHFETPVVFTDKKGNTREEVKFIPSDLPLFSAFAVSIGTHRETLINWTKAVDKKGNLKYPEFFDAYKKAKEYQRNILITNGIKGLYSVAFAIFTAKNIIGWKDRQDITSDDEKIEGIILYKPKKKKI